MDLMGILRIHMTRITWIDSLESDRDIVSGKKVLGSWRNFLHPNSFQDKGCACWKKIGAVVQKLRSITTD
jgi:hypothetical protein